MSKWILTFLSFSCLNACTTSSANHADEEYNYNVQGPKDFGVLAFERDSQARMLMQRRNCDSHLDQERYRSDPRPQVEIGVQRDPKLAFDITQGDYYIAGGCH